MAKIYYDKLVRDNIESIIRTSGKTCKIKTVTGDEKLEYLFKKVNEEVNELKSSRSPEEFADVLEVLDAIASEMNIDKDSVFAAKNSKKEKNGSFENGIVLLEVDDNK